MGETTKTDEIRQKVLDESAGRCCVCSAHIGFQVDVVPIVPLNEGGTFAPSNLAVLCPFCRWLVQRQRISPTALKAFKRHWLTEAAKAPPVYREDHLKIQGEPLRLEAIHHGTVTILEGSELGSLLANFFNCLDTFLIHEDQHLENAASLAVIRAFRDMYNYVPPERDIKELASADSRKLDLLYRAIRGLFSVGLAGKPRQAQRKATGKAARKPAARSKSAKKPKKAVKSKSKRR